MSESNKVTVTGAVEYITRKEGRPPAYKVGNRWLNVSSRSRADLPVPQQGDHIQAICSVWGQNDGLYIDDLIIQSRLTTGPGSSPSSNGAHPVSSTPPLAVIPSNHPLSVQEVRLRVLEAVSPFLTSNADVSTIQDFLTKAEEAERWVLDAEPHTLPEVIQEEIPFA